MRTRVELMRAVQAGVWHRCWPGTVLAFERLEVRIEAYLPPVCRDMMNGSCQASNDVLWAAHGAGVESGSPGA